MPLFLINHFGKQELVELDNDRHIKGEILWRDDKHGPLPEGLIVGAMDLNLVEEEIGDLLCMIDLLQDKGILDPNNIAAAFYNKKEKLRKWSPDAFNDEL